MRDATDLEANSVNDYVNRISVDTGVNFYSRRGKRGMTLEIVIIMFLSITVSMIIGFVIGVTYRK